MKKVWNLETGEELFTLKHHPHCGWVTSVAVTADGKRAISGSLDGTIKVWNLETGENLFTLTGHSGSVQSVAVTADGKRVISGYWNRTIMWNLETREVIATFKSHAPFFSCAVAPDGVTIVAGDRCGMVHFLKLENQGE